MADIEINHETEATGHWQYAVTIFDCGRRQTHQVTLSFQDYDLWSRGRVAPSRVVEAAFEYLLDHEPAGSILPKFDCSIIRRHFPAVDRELPGRI